VGYFASSIAGKDLEATKRKKKTYLLFGLIVILLEVLVGIFIRYKLYQKRRSKIRY
jgi:hypothetical protein